MGAGHLQKRSICNSHSELISQLQRPDRHKRKFRMLSKLKGKPLWYKVWAVASAFAAIFVLVRVFYTEELQRVDHALLVFTLVSSLLDSSLFPPEEKSARMSQKKRAVVTAVGAAIGFLAAALTL